MRLASILQDCGRLFWGSAFSMLLHLITLPVMAKMYSPSDIGVWGYIMAIVMAIAVFLNLRLDVVLPSLKSFGDALMLARSMVILGAWVSFTILVVLVLSRPVWAKAIPQMTAMGFTIYLLPLATFVYSIYSAARALAVRKAKFSEIGRAQIWRAVAWSLVWMGLGYSQVVTAPGGGLIIGQVVADLFFAVLLLRGQSPRARLFLLNAGAVRQKQAISAHRGIILSIFLSQLLASFHSRLTLLTIGAVFGPVQVGYYTLSERIVAAPEVASSIIADVYRQRAAQAYFKREKFNRLMLNILGLTLLLSVIPYGIAIYLTPKLVVPILGAEWQPAAFTIKLVLISSLISFNCATVDKSPLIVGAHRYMVIFQAVRLLVEVIPAVCAVVGLLSLEAYLIFIVAGRSLVMIGDTGVGYVLASKVHAVAIPR